MENDDVANTPINTRVEPELLKRLDNYIAFERNRTGIKIERSAVLRAALDAYLKAAVAKIEEMAAES